VVVERGTTLGSGEGGLVSGEKHTLGSAAGSAGMGSRAGWSEGSGPGGGAVLGGVGVLASKKIVASCCKAACWLSVRLIGELGAAEAGCGRAWIRSRAAAMVASAVGAVGMATTVGNQDTVAVMCSAEVSINQTR